MSGRIGKLAMVALAKVKPASDNPRRHDEPQVQQLVASVAEFGWPAPILIDEDGVILAGHGRYLAAQAIYAAGGSIRDVPAGKVPCVSVRGLTASERKAYRIADNRLAALSAFDPQLLAAELSELSVEGIEFEVLGFSAQDMARLDEDTARLQIAAFRDDGEAAAATFTDQPPAATDAAPVVRLEVLIPALDRQIVYDALQKARAQFNAPAAGDALAALVAQTSALA